MTASVTYQVIFNQALFDCYQHCPTATEDVNEKIWGYHASLDMIIFNACSFMASPNVS